MGLCLWTFLATVAVEGACASQPLRLGLPPTAGLSDLLRVWFGCHSRWTALDARCGFVPATVAVTVEGCVCGSHKHGCVCWQCFRTCAVVCLWAVAATWLWHSWCDCACGQAQPWQWQQPVWAGRHCGLPYLLRLLAGLFAWLFGLGADMLGTQPWWSRWLCQ